MCVSVERIHVCILGLAALGSEFISSDSPRESAQWLQIPDKQLLPTSAANLLLSQLMWMPACTEDTAENVTTEQEAFGLSGSP